MTVLRLQVQRLPLKPGERGARVYDPTPVTVVEALEVGPRGCVGHLGNERILDAHHADHPQTRNRGLDNGLSLLTVKALTDLHEVYGSHVVPGETLLVEDLPPGDLLLEVSGPDHRHSAGVVGFAEAEGERGLVLRQGVGAAIHLATGDGDVLPSKADPRAEAVAVRASPRRSAAHPA